MPGRFSLTVVVIVAAITWAIALTAGGWNLSYSFFGPTSIVVSVLVVLSLLFDRWLWALPLVNKIWHRPDLRGTWKGELRSNYPGALEPIEAYLSIHQTFSGLVISQFTKESGSVTNLAVIRSGEGRVDTLVGLYFNEPDLPHRHRSQMHDGSFVLQIRQGNELAGKYWTERSTQGQMAFHRVSQEESTDFGIAQARDSR